MPESKLFVLGPGRTKEAQQPNFKVVNTGDVNIDGKLEIFLNADGALARFNSNSYRGCICFPMMLSGSTAS